MSSPTPSPSREALRDFLALIEQVDREYLGPERNVTAPADIAAGEHMLLHLIKCGLDTWVDNDAARPRFAPLASAVLKWGGEGADNPSHCAPLDPDAPLPHHGPHARRGLHQLHRLHRQAGRRLQRRRRLGPEPHPVPPRRRRAASRSRSRPTPQRRRPPHAARQGELRDRATLLRARGLRDGGSAARLRDRHRMPRRARLPAPALARGASPTSCAPP